VGFGPMLMVVVWVLVELVVIVSRLRLEVLVGAMGMTG
jgi:hypothetical protein